MSPDTLKVLMRMEYEDELRLCVKLYNQHGGCKFNEGTRCEKCGSIPLLVTLITGRTHHCSLDELIVKEKLFKYNK